MSNNNLPPCKYVVVARYRDIDEKDGKVKFFGVEKEFAYHPDNPILDREAAFAYRDELICNLLEAKGVPYEKVQTLTENEKRDLMCKHYFTSPNDKEWEEKYRNQWEKEEYVPTAEEQIVLKEWEEMINNNSGVRYCRSRPPIPKHKLVKKRNDVTYICDGEEKPFIWYGDAFGVGSRESQCNFEGIWVVFKYEPSIKVLAWDRYEEILKDKHYKKSLLIDCIINKGWLKNYMPADWSELQNELEFYKENEFSTIGNKDSYEIKVEFFDDMDFYDGYWEEANMEIEMLKTPFDWTGYNEPFWWGDPSSQYDREYLAYIKREKEWEENMPTWEDATNSSGENQYVEYKPSLHSTKELKPSLGQMHQNAKSICAFLNAKGGYLFIGVNNNGDIIGLNNDFKLLSENQNAESTSDPDDNFLIKFTELKRRFFENSVHTFIDGYFKGDEDSRYFVVEVRPSTSPVFLIKEDIKTKEVVKEFYYRDGSSSIQIQDPEVLVRYCKNHWKWKREKE